jgi:hypothetical protein
MYENEFKNKVTYFFGNLIDKYNKKPLDEKTMVFNFINKFLLDYKLNYDSNLINYFVLNKKFDLYNQIESLFEDNNFLKNNSLNICYVFSLNKILYKINKENNNKIKELLKNYKLEPKLEFINLSYNNKLEYSNYCNLYFEFNKFLLPIVKKTYVIKKEIIKKEEKNKLKPVKSKKQNIKKQIIKKQIIKPIKKQILKKKYVNKGLKEKIWLNNFGNQFEVLCPCCEIRNINPFSFSTGHIKPESKGGETSVKNLKPICCHCNSRMGTLNYYDYKNKIT